MEELNDIQSIEKNILERHLKEFFKKNSQAIALIFKALIKGEKIYPKEEISQEILRINNQETLSANFPSNNIPLPPKEIQKTQNNPTKQNSSSSKTDLLESKSSDRSKTVSKKPASPLNIEG